MFAEGITAICQAGLTANQYADLLDLTLGEFEGQQYYSGFIATGGSANNSEKFVEISERNEVTLERFGALLRFTQLKPSAAQHDIAAMLDVAGVRFLERKKFWPAMINRQQNDRERAFHRGVLVEVVDHDLWVAVAFQFDNDPRILIGLVTNGANVCQHFFVYQRRDAFNEGCAIDVIWNFSDDDLLPAAFKLFDAGLAAHLHTAATSLEILFDSRHAADDAAGREVRPFYVFHQLLERDFRIVDLCTDSINHFVEIVRRNIGRHTHSDACSAINEQIWKGSRENRRLGACFVIIWDEIDRVLIHVGHQRGAEMRHARFGVTHRSWGIAFDGAEVTLAVDERFTHRPRLGHVDERGIDHRFAVRVIISAGVTANLRAFAVLSSRKKREVMHRIKNSSLRWLESIAHVR